MAAFVYEPDIQDMETAAPVGVAHPLHETAPPSIPSAYAPSHAETAEAATHAAQSGDNMFLDPDDISECACLPLSRLCIYCDCCAESGAAGYMEGHCCPQAITWSTCHLRNN